jgi:hypothetical protein
MVYGVYERLYKREKAKNLRPWWTENSDPCGWMINDLITAFIVAFAASIASALSPGFGNIFDGVEGRISQSRR